MANGPLGGNMGTPPIAPQPPQVSFTTTAESRGGFNDFLRSIPSTMNMMPPYNPMGGNPMPPMGGNPMDNIDIFNQPMGMMGMNQPQMNPMMQPPMQQPMMQQPMMMEYGGNVPPRETEIRGQDHMLAYITPEEGGILQALGGSGRPGPMGIPSYYGEGSDSDGEGDGGEGSDADGGGDGGGGGGNDGGNDGNGNDGTDTNESSTSTDSPDANDDDTATSGEQNSSTDTTGSNDMGMDSSVADQASVQGGMSQGVSGQENSQGSASYGMNTYGTVPSYPQGQNFSTPNIGLDPDDPMSAANQAADMSNTVGFSADSQANVDTPTTTGTPANTVTGINKGLTNITNVGKNSNLSYSPQFSADLAQSRGLDPSVTMNAVDFGMTTQGQAAAAAQEAENMALDQATNNTNTMANQVLGTTPNSTSLSAADKAAGIGLGLGLDIDVPGMGSNYGANAPTAIGAGRGTGYGFGYGANPDLSPTVGNAPGAASTTTANVANQNAGNIAGVTTGPEMMSNMDIAPAYSASLNDKEDTLGVLGPGVMGQIEALSTQPTTMDQLGMPPGMINSLLSVVENMSRNSIMSDLASGKYSAVTDSRGNITGSQDQYGNLQSGMDMNASDTSPSEGGDTISSISRPSSADPLLPQDPFSMGIFGNADRATAPKNPFLVDSPFTSNIADFKPVDFSAGDLNALIAKLTGVAAPKGMRQGGVARYAGGGLISAVDRFLASAR
jgi:hypothetical protein